MFILMFIMFINVTNYTKLLRIFKFEILLYLKTFQKS